MKILYLSQLFTHSAGGGEKVFRQYAQHFSQKGNQVFVVCQKSCCNCMKPNGIKIYEISFCLSGFLPNMIDSLSYLIKGVYAGLRIITNHKIQLIHSNNFVSMLIGSIISTITGVPHIATIHHIFTVSRLKITRHQTRLSWFFSLYTSCKQAFLSILFNFFNANLIIMPSRKSLDDIRYLGYKGSVTVIPNGVTLPNEKLYNFDSKTDSYSKPYILFLGRHVFYKNLDTVIKAIKIVVSKNREVTLIISGDGPMRTKWGALVKNLHLERNVQFVGFISEEEKDVLLAGCIALVFPSVVEGFGLTVLEALAMAKPVLIADIEPVNELVESSVDGYKIARYYDENEWARDIIDLLSDPHKAEEMGQNGRKKIIEKHLLNDITKRVENLYQQIRLKNMQGSTTIDV